MRIGVLSLQGAFREHLDTLDAIGVEGVRVREPADLAGVSGLILPGGESTTMRQLIERWGLHGPILDLADARRADLRDVRRDDRAGHRDRRWRSRRSCRSSTSPSSAMRSAASSSRSRPSSTSRSSAARRSTRSSSAPRSSSGPGPSVDVLARLDDGRIVAVRQRNIIATAFHPELAGETRFHRLVATMAAEHDDPGEGSGRRPHPTRRSLAARHDESTR